MPHSSSSSSTCSSTSSSTSTSASSTPLVHSRELRSPSLRPSIAQQHTSEKLMTMRDRRIRALIEAVAGVGGNFYAASIMQPMDVVKMRMQVPGSPYTSILNAFTTIAREEGMMTLYTGLASELIKGGLQNFIYLYVYQFMKDLLAHRDRLARYRARLSQLSQRPSHTSLSSHDSQHSSSQTSLNTSSSQTSLNTSSSQSSLHPIGSQPSLHTQQYITAVEKANTPPIKPSLPPSQPLPMGMNLLIGILAGCITQIFVNPLSVVQTRIMTHKHIAGQQSLGLWGMTWKIIAQEGIWALYAGMLPAFILTTNPAIQYLVFDRLKDSWTRFLYKREKPRNPSSFELFIIGAIAKIVATLVTYPYIMAKVRLQWKGEGGQAPKYTGTMDVMSQILKTDGFFGLYTGLQPQLFKSVCSASLLLMAKEKCARFLEAIFLPAPSTTHHPTLKH